MGVQPAQGVDTLRYEFARLLYGKQAQLLRPQEPYRRSILLLIQPSIEMNII